MKILIVEDDMPSRELLQIFLSDFGTCDLAANGHEALEAVSEAIQDEDPYDLICMDIMMPMMDGMEALQKIRHLEFKNFNPKVANTSSKVIMVTAKGQATDVMNAFESGCEAYLTKPISKEKLCAQMAELGLIEPSGDEHA